jgi:plasma-membrane calcium-translocating P-type ATPase
MQEDANINKVKTGGLTAAEVETSRARHGANVLTPPRRKSLWRLYLEKYEDPIIRILLVAAAVSLVLAFVENDFIETIGIILAVFFATTVGFYFERDAAKKFDVLTALDEEQPVKVLRDGVIQQVARHDVVVGDVIIVETGDEIPADGLLFEAVDLQVDESSLTGEALTTKNVHDGDIKDTKDNGAYPKDLLLRSAMVMNGSGRFVVTAVGDHTEIGKVARQATELTAIKTPLNIQLDRLAKLISKVGSAVSILAFLAFLVHDILTKPLWHTTDYVGMAEVVLRYFMMAVTLIVMAVPEGLPMAVTLALALNMRRMLKSNNLVRKLTASETMGAVTVICTDKTGTLTQNRMTVVEVRCPTSDGKWSDVSPLPSNLYRAIAMNTTATHNVGNPTEQALLQWLQGQGVDYQQMRDSATITSREPFSTERKYMSTTVGNVTYLKGAPEIILAKCSLSNQERKEAESLLREWQQRAMRTLAIAQDSTLLAIIAISDPLRKDVPSAVKQCREAGIEVKIVTGDTAATAAEIGRQTGIVSNDSGIITGSEFAALHDDEALAIVKDIKVMSRARPSDKQRLVELLQQQGEVVAVTGDGTNDAPALNHAHVGLSLGSGTNVAKNASDITLIDDSFRSIVQAVMWGRSLYKNIQRFIFFQLVVNVAALLLVLAGSVIGTELPLTVTQILWVNLIMDTFAAMALASLPPSREVMHQCPRSQDDFIITRGMMRGVIGLGVLFAVAMFIYLYRIEMSDGGIDIHELTVFFTTFVMLQWWNLLNARTLSSCHSAFRYIWRCRGLLLVLLMILVGQWLIVTFGGKMFRTVPLPPLTWLTIIVGTSPVLWLGEAYRLILRIWEK